MAQALAAGYRRVLCCAEIEDAYALAESEGPAKLAGERRLEHIEGFDFGNSPRELAGEPAAETLVLSTTNGTRLLVAAAARFEQVFVGSLLNLGAVRDRGAARPGRDVAVLCAGVLGELALDDAYCAGRIVAALGGEHADSAAAAARLAASFPNSVAGLGASQARAQPPQSTASRTTSSGARGENALDVVPRFGLRMVGPAAEVVRPRGFGTA